MKWIGRASEKSLRMGSAGKEAWHMFKQRVVLCLGLFLACMSGFASGDGPSGEWNTTETFVRKIDLPSHKDREFSNRGLDGTEERSYMGANPPAVSPDRKSAAFGAGRGGKRFIVIDGKEQKEYDDVLPQTLAFSPDSSRVGYVAVRGSQRFVVVDGQEGKEYHTIMKPGPLFSPDSRRVAYTARVGNRWFVVVDGKEQKQYDEILAGTLEFSHDGTRVAYTGEVGSKRMVVVDGEEGKAYDAIAASTPVFSPDCSRFAYGARIGDGWFMVVGGKEGKRYQALRGHPIALFSDDSKRVAYTAETATKQVVAVVDGKEGKGYDDIVGLTFSPGSRRIAYVAREGAKQFVVVDDKEEKGYDAIVGDRQALVVFDSDDSFYYLALKGEGLYIIEMRTPGAPPKKRIQPGRMLGQLTREER